MRIIFLALGLTAIWLGWNMPNHYPLWTTFHAELASAIGVWLIWIGVVWPQDKSAVRGRSQPSAVPSPVFRLPMPAAARVWLLVALIPLIQLATGLLVFRGDAALGFLYCAGVGLSLYIGYLWAAQAGAQHVVKVVFVTLLFAALAEGGFALAQWLRLPASGWWAMELIESRPYGNFAQPNLFALSMVMGIVASTTLFEMGVLQSRLSHALTLAFFGGCLIVSESRACAFATLAIAACWFATRHRVPTRLRVFDVLLALALGYALYRSLGFLEEALYLRPSASRAPFDVGLRQWIWAHFWAAITQRPWFGYGFGQGVLALHEVAAAVHPSHNTIYAHNIVLDLMTWVGIPLGALMSLSLSTWLMSWLRRHPDVELSRLRHGVFALWLALLFHSMLEFPYAHAFFLLPAALLAGAITANDKLPRAHRAAASLPALALATVTAVLLAATTVDYFQFETEFRAIRFDKGNFVDVVEREPPDRPWVLDQLAALNASSHFVIRSGMPVDEIEKLGQLARRFHLLPTKFAYAKALALNGRRQEAAQEMQTIRNIYQPAAYAAIEREWNNWLTEQFH